MWKCIWMTTVGVMLVLSAQAAPKSAKAPTIKQNTPAPPKSVKPASSPGVKTSTKHAVHGAKHVAPPVKSIAPSPTKPPAVTKTPVIPGGPKMMKAKAILPSSTSGGGSTAPVAPDVKLPGVSAFDRGRRRRELDGVFGDGPLLMFEDLKHGIDLGEGDGGGPVIPRTPGDRRTAPGSAIGGLFGPNPAASSGGIGGSAGQPSPPPEPPPDDGGDVVGGGGGKPKQVMDFGMEKVSASPVPPTPIGDPDPPKPEESWIGRSGEAGLGPQPEPPDAGMPGSARPDGEVRDFGVGKAAHARPRPRPVDPDPPEPDDEMTADSGLQAAGLRGGGGGDGFRDGPRTQPGGGDGDGISGEEPPDFTKAPEGRKMPSGHVIQKPLVGPIDPIDPVDPIGQPGPDGANPTIMRSEPVDPLKRSLERTDPAGGAGDSALEP